MSVSFEGIGQVCATFLGSGVTEGSIITESGVTVPFWGRLIMGTEHITAR